MSMKLIIDTSILIAVLVSEPERDRIVSLTKDADLLAPQSVHWEIGNALSAMIKRQRISLDQALKVIKVYETIPIRSVDTDLHEAISIAGKYGLYAYDAYLIACALHQRCSMMSLDIALIQTARKAGVTVVEVPKE
jgi:predicted nucleic acid-binding protein